MMKFLKMAMVIMVMLACSDFSVQAETPTTYNRIDEIMDWGAATTKLIVDLKADVPQGAIDPGSFSVHVVRKDERFTEPLLEEGYRTVVDAYVSDADGNPADPGGFATLVMEIGPAMSLGAALNYGEDPATGSRANVWNQNSYTITQQKTIGGTAGDLVATDMGRYARLLVDRFELGASAYDDEEYGLIELTYAHYRPALDDQNHPLIIWLHGGGEGGTDATIPLAANKACVFAAEEVQAYFDGAYVLVPQAPTKWMDARKEGKQSGLTKDNAISIYTRALQDLVESYVAESPAIDSKRIYVGGVSNGGFMAIRLILDYPKYYAAAVPVSEALNDKYVTDKEVEGIMNVPIWFVTSATDPNVPPHMFAVKLFDRLAKLGAPNIYISYLRRVLDESGLYTNDDGTPYEYNGHWSWVYVYNNDLSQVIGGENTVGRLHGGAARHNNDVSQATGSNVVSLMEWLAAQSK